MKKQLYICPVVDVIAINHNEALMTGSIQVKDINTLNSDLDPYEEELWTIDEAE